MEKGLKILMLEDSDSDAELVKRILVKDNFKFETLIVNTREEFEAALSTFCPDVVLSDHSLPQFDSHEALLMCQKTNRDIPFILVTGAVSEEFAVTCLKNGADDYILKANLSRLPQAIQRALLNHSHENVRKANEEMLNDQNAELIKINQELDTLVYSVSHNLRSPLASILGLTQIAHLDKEKTKDTTDEYFNMIAKSALKLDGTIKEILDYSKNSRSETRYEVVDLKKLVDESYEQMKYLKGHENVELLCSVEGTDPICSDLYRLSVILDNLISNAFKYSDAKKSKSFIHVGAIVTPEQVIITVHDNGIGIFEDYIKKVFTMFFRATDCSEGAGLGLFIVKEMVEKLKGKIELTSVFNKETLFTLTIPNRSSEVNLPEAIIPTENASLVGSGLPTSFFDYPLKSDEYINHIMSIVESSDDAIISKSLDGTIKSWNRGGEKLFGYKETEAVGKNISIIIPKEYREEEKRILDKIYNNEIINHYETIRNKKNGERFFVSLSASPLKTKKAKLLVYLKYYET